MSWEGLISFSSWKWILGNIFVYCILIPIAYVIAGIFLIPLACLIWLFLGESKLNNFIDWLNKDKKKKGE